MSAVTREGPDHDCLFQTGNFTLASGQKSLWKIECDALTPADWAGLAAIAVEFLPPFSEAVGVPRGGIAFADALTPYADVDARALLIADDVWTTGDSMKEYAARHHPKRHWFGVVAFARNKPDYYVKALFQMPCIASQPPGEGPPVQVSDE